MRFLANENIPVASIKLLRQSGYNVSAIIEDTPGETDRTILARASKEERVILTFDRDYGELIYSQGLSIPAGVVYFRFDPVTPEEPAQFLLRLVSFNELVLPKMFTVVERNRLRQRPLPTIDKEAKG
jgi:predicted nuclease of predicted toxin-antitoxin system